MGKGTRTRRVGTLAGKREGKRGGREGGHGLCRPIVWASASFRFLGWVRRPGFTVRNFLAPIPDRVCGRRALGYCGAGRGERRRILPVAALLQIKWFCSLRPTRRIYFTWAKDRIYTSRAVVVIREYGVGAGSGDGNFHNMHVA